MSHRNSWSAALLATLASLAPAATIRVGNPSEFRQALARARAGTVVSLAPGRYRGYFLGRGLHGSPDAPIVIEAANPDNPPLFLGTSECIHLSNVSHLVLRNLSLAGATVNGLNIDDGGTLTRPSHHLVLDGLKVRDVGPRGNRDGIKLSGVDDFLMVNCTVRRWGSGGSAVDMVGCHRGVIADCQFQNTPGRGASGLQAKGGSSDILICRCAFRSAGARAINMGGSTARPYFRPPNPGYEAKRIVAIANTITASLAPVAFVGCDECRATYNTIYRPRGWVVRILQESRGPGFVPCRNGLFAHNLVVWRELRTTVNVGSATAPETFRFRQNWWWRQDGPTPTDLRLPVKEVGGVVGRDPHITLEGERLVVSGAPHHGAHAPEAASRLADHGPKLAPWAFGRLSATRARRAHPGP